MTKNEEKCVFTRCWWKHLQFLINLCWIFCCNSTLSVWNWLLCTLIILQLKIVLFENIPVQGVSDVQSHRYVCVLYYKDIKWYAYTLLMVGLLAGAGWLAGCLQLRLSSMQGCCTLQPRRLAGYQYNLNIYILILIT